MSSKYNPEFWKNLRKEEEDQKRRIRRASVEMLSSTISLNLKKR